MTNVSYLILSTNHECSVEMVWNDKTKFLTIQVQLVHGKGLRIANLHPSDQGVYVCEASNLMGAVTAAANLTVSESPVITVKPLARLVAVEGTGDVTLQCMVTGSPKPAAFWILEEKKRYKFFTQALKPYYPNLCFTLAICIM